MKYTFASLLAIMAIAHQSLSGQQLRPGYDRAELADMICINAHIADSVYLTGKKFIARPAHYQKVFRSPEVGLLNLCELWVSDQKQAVISIRGTTAKAQSWIANFFAAMVPAKGQLVFSGRDTFNYQLASNPQAAVHAGWLISMAYLSREILPRIDSCYKAGIRDFIITGHSQGGAIAFLLTAHLLHLRETKALPSDIRFKTYCTAAPKPGNLYFAYDYEYDTRGGWAFNVVNSKDWVPEVPVTIQTVTDFNAVNPFKNAKKAIKKLKFPVNLVVRHIYNKLEKPPRKAQQNYQKYLGNLMSKQLKKNLEGITIPPYYPSSYYVRVGQTVVLEPDTGYFRRFPQSDTNIFGNHMHHAYIYLIDKSRLGITIPGQAANPKYDSVLAKRLGGNVNGMKKYVLVMLKTGSNQSADKAFIDSCFTGHFSNMKRLVGEGKLIVAGPLGKNDQTYRGIFILNVTTLEEAREIVQTDPAVNAQLLDADLYQWYGSAALPEYLDAAEKIVKNN